MLPQNLNFSYNWNNKLECSAFTTIRLRNDDRYNLNAVFIPVLNVKKSPAPKEYPRVYVASWPEDMESWDESDRLNPRLNTVYGWGKKSDDGWENIFFFTKDPSEKLKARFDELSGVVPNSTMNREDKDNKDLWIIGWF